MHVVMANSAENGAKGSMKPKIWANPERSLQGKDLLPLVMQLQAGQNDELKGKAHQNQGELASFKEGHLLQSYSDEELGSEFKKLTGYEIQVSLPSSQVCLGF